MSSPGPQSEKVKNRIECYVKHCTAAATTYVTRPTHWDGPSHHVWPLPYCDPHTDTRRRSYAWKGATYWDINEPLHARLYGIEDGWDD